MALHERRVGAAARSAVGGAAVRAAVFAAGLAISSLMVARAQVGGDQLNLLARGWLLAERGELVPYGNPRSDGGNEPGPLTSLLVGLPLLLWRDHRAPVVLIAASHVLAYLLLDRLLQRAAGGRERLLFAVLYWLSPWRLYLSGFLWNPNFLFLAGAAHAATAWRLRERPRFLATFLHVLTLACAFQLHPAFVILLFASLLLWLRKWLRPSWWGVAAGTAASLAMLAPWLRAISQDPTILAGEGQGFLLRGLLLVFPLVRGALFWLRYGSLHTSGAFTRFDLPTALNALVWPLVHVLAPATVLLAAWANWRLLRRWRHRIAPGGERRRHWLRCYVLACLAGAFVAFAISPTTAMFWQGLPVFHAAVLAVVLCVSALLRSRRTVLTRRLLVAWGLAAVALGATMALRGPHYRCGARPTMGLGLTLRQDHPMLHDLGLWRTCSYPLAEDGWWPDVLPER